MIANALYRNAIATKTLPMDNASSDYSHWDHHITRTFIRQPNGYPSHSGRTKIKYAIIT